MSEIVQRGKRRLGREGNRWVNERPSGEELSTWFMENVPIDDRLKHAHYVAGVTLIPANEKTKELVGWDEGNSPVLRDVWDLVLTPYIRVETRVAYFHDLMAEEKTVGLIEPVELDEQDPRLPKGFFRLVTTVGTNLEVRYIGCTMQVTVYKKGTLQDIKVSLDKRTGEEGLVRVGKILYQYTPASKVVPVLSYDKPDPFSLMKAETGAVGRALGMAGMLVIPGTGIASAEDLQEAANMEKAPTPVDASLPDDDFESAAQVTVEGTDEELREQATAIIEELGEFPLVVAEFKAWAKERGYSRLSEVTQPALRGLVRRAQNMLTDARKSGGDEENLQDRDPSGTDTPPPAQE